MAKKHLMTFMCLIWTIWFAGASLKLLVKSRPVAIIIPQLSMAKKYTSMAAMMEISGLMTYTYLTQWVWCGRSLKWVGRSPRRAPATQWAELGASCTCLGGMTATSVSMTSTSSTWTRWPGSSPKSQEWSPWRAMPTLWLSSETNYTYLEATQETSTSKISTCLIPKHWLGQSPRFSGALQRVYEVTQLTWSVTKSTCSGATMVEESLSRRSSQAMISMCWIRTLCGGVTQLKMKRHRLADSATPHV